MSMAELALIFMTFLLGVRHGFDLDHLATIDAMTRTASHNKRLSKRVGVLFSLGHGLVVTLISAIISSGIMKSQTPQWLESFGSWISILFLMLFGLLNLYNVIKNPLEKTASISLISLFATNMLKKSSSPLFIILVGALFAFSFDTFSQVALFSISASILSGWIFAAILGIVFMLGMMMSDGLNGVLISILIQRAGSMSLFISRFVGIAISLFSLVIGVVALVKMF